jgi:uncharacterized protein YbjQ (UPF0145 family)
MSEVEKYLEMLANSKAGKRYEACEWLRVCGTSSKEIVLALESATKDSDPEVANAATRALNSEAHEAMLASMGRRSAAMEERYRQAEKAKAAARILVTTTHSIDGRTIGEYKGVVWTQCVMVSGLMSNIDAATAATFAGGKSDVFTQKLEATIAEAIQALHYKAADLGADAVLSLRLQYAPILAGMFAVVAYGTGVTLNGVDKLCNTPA